MSILFWISVAIALAGLLGLVWQRRRFLREVLHAREELAWLSKELTRVNEQSRLAIVAKQASDDQLKSLTIRLEASYSANQAFQNSRDQVWDLYRRSANAAGHAQEWLARELGVALGQLNAYRVQDNKPPAVVPAGLTDLLEEFKGQHVDRKDIP